MKFSFYHLLHRLYFLRLSMHNLAYNRNKSVSQFHFGKSRDCILPALSNHVLGIGDPLIII